MKASLLDKLESLADRYEELGALLSDAEIIADQRRFRALSREYAEVEPVARAFHDYQGVLSDIDEASALLDDADPEMRSMAEEELRSSRDGLEERELTLQKLLLPKDARDGANVFLEIRAGTGGDEAALFAGDLYRMYARYAESRGWRIEIIGEREGEHGGYKELILRVVGSDVYSRLKFESGAHRVQRVPETESQGRIHTSACTVAVLAEVEQIDEVSIDKNELRIDTFRASGAGGQHLNKKY